MCMFFSKLDEVRNSTLGHLWFTLSNKQVIQRINRDYTMVFRIVSIFHAICPGNCNTPITFPDFKTGPPLKPAITGVSILSLLMADFILKPDT